MIGPFNLNSTTFTKRVKYSKQEANAYPSNRKCIKKAICDYKTVNCKSNLTRIGFLLKKNQVLFKY